MTDHKSRQFSLGGIRIDALEQADLIQIIDEAVLTHDKLVITNHNLHSLYLYETDPVFRHFYKQASWVYVDGLPIVWLGKIAGLPFTTAHRITFLDSFDAILHDAARHGWRVFYLGSTEAALTRGLDLLRKRHANLTINGHNGFFPKSQNETITSEINRLKTDVLFVGMGMPMQEKWVAENQAQLRVSAILTCGATLDYVSGDTYLPPAWAGRLGLYGLFRLFADPKRLYRRYLVEPLLLTKHLPLRLIQQRLGPLRSIAVESK